MEDVLGWREFEGMDGDYDQDRPHTCKKLKINKQIKNPNSNGDFPY